MTWTVSTNKDNRGISCMLRWLAAVAVLLVTLAALTATPAFAEKYEPRAVGELGDADSVVPMPEISEMRWLDPPVTVAQESCHEPQCPGEELLVIEAADPDGVITAIDVLAVEVGSGTGWAVHADLVCPTLAKPGRTATVSIPVAFTAPGLYRIEARAWSQPSCGPLPPATGQASEVERLDTVVEPAPE